MKNAYLSFTFFAWIALSAYAHDVNADSSPASNFVIFADDFEREESNPAKEEVGKGWTTNSKSRAKGVKQVDLDSGSLHITRAEVADHGVSVVHDLGFQDGVIELRFKLGAKDDLGINIADLKEKSVHAGHLCMARIQLDQVEIVDLKTGRMLLESRERRLANKETLAEKKAVKEKSKFFKVDLSEDQWHQLRVTIVGSVMSVAIDGDDVGEFQSSGMGHPTKRTLRLAVNKNAWVDDVTITRHK